MLNINFKSLYGDKYNKNLVFVTDEQGFLFIARQNVIFSF